VSVASWAVLNEQVVSISPRATGFTVVCERCAADGAFFPSVHATLSLDHRRGTIECPRGHTIGVERAGC
jgi:hypothetical protein